MLLCVSFRQVKEKKTMDVVPMGICFPDTWKSPGISFYFKNIILNQVAHESNEPLSWTYSVITESG